MYYVYLLRCADGTLYTGFTNDLARRLAAHNAGRGAKYTRGRRPVELGILGKSFLQQILCPAQGSMPSSSSPGGRSSPDSILCAFPANLKVRRAAPHSGPPAFCKHLC